MTLHEAILEVLHNHGKPMSAQEIAEVINQHKLYIRKDGDPLKGGQINARISNHPELFTREDGLIQITPQYKYERQVKTISF